MSKVSQKDSVIHQQEENLNMINRIIQQTISSFDLACERIGLTKFDRTDLPAEMKQIHILDAVF